MRVRVIVRRGCIALAGAWLLAAAPAPVRAQNIPITLTESGGQTRVAEPVTSGVPITPADVGASWALFDGATEIPLQTTVLPNVTTPWLLLDFQLSLTADNIRHLTLRRQAPAAAPAKPVVVTEDANQITVTNGPLRTLLSKTTFNVFDEVWFDADGDGVFEAGEQRVSPTATSNLTIHDVGGNRDASGRGTPTRIEWEYQGPMRATLRVDGNYVASGTTVLAYTTRITWCAGQTGVRIEQVVRNSSATQERYVKLSTARVVIGAAGTLARIARSGATAWSNAPAGNATLELIPATLVVSTGYPPRSNATINVDANGGMVIGDLSHHGGTWVVDFAPGIDPREALRRAAVAADPMLALADESRYRDTGAFGLVRGSTYADEKTAYQRWGWTWPTPGNPWSYEHHPPRLPSFYASWSDLDAMSDPESDGLWQDIVMLGRVQLPYYLDRARAWSRYMKWEWAFRTDGFSYAGAWGNPYDGPGTVARPLLANTALTALDNAWIAHNIKHGKASVSHMWNGGLLDWYYLTGDRDALDAALDTAEQCDRYFYWQTPSINGVGTNARFPSRALLVMIRTWEATNVPRWRSASDHIVSLFTRSATYDTRGFFYGRMQESGPAYVSRYGANAKHVSPFMMGTAVEALYRYYAVTGDPEVAAQLVEIATFGRDHGVDPITQYTGDDIVVDSPGAGDVRHLTYSQWLNQVPGIPYAESGSTMSFINATIVGFRLTGDSSYLQSAKWLWNQASKRESIDPYTKHFATATQVGRFANSVEGWEPTTLLYPYAGDWTTTSLLFYEAAREPPGNIRDLRVEQ